MQVQDQQVTGCFWTGEQCSESSKWLVCCHFSISHLFIAIIRASIIQKWVFWSFMQVQKRPLIYEQTEFHISSFFCLLYSCFSFACVQWISFKTIYTKRMNQHCPFITLAYSPTYPCLIQTLLLSAFYTHSGTAITVLVA